MPYWVRSWPAFCTIALVTCSPNHQSPPVEIDAGRSDVTTSTVSSSSAATRTDVDAGREGRAEAGVAADASLTRDASANDSDAGAMLDAAGFDASDGQVGVTNTSAPDTTSIAPPEPCEVVAPTSCPNPAPNWTDVEPVVDAVCVVCHYGAAQGPWPLTSYQHVADWQNEIRGALLNCTMPPPDDNVRITAEERLLILEWIRCGLPR